MLQINNIKKQYQVGDFVSHALRGVSLNLRKSEFISILGPSGSGKTTLLNIIGGLDRYDDGDLIINNISTKNYQDKDWDSYRNHTVGFVFQSYNLISHQSILANVELALTISGISKSERKKRATEALTSVGLKDHINKKPNQLSGGQMQRVAIARALVNNPSIVLADEPTGALDSETSVSIMNLLKEVARDRLVVMVTHNPELAYEYSTRIVSVKDGNIVDDTNPYEPEKTKTATHKNMGKASMSFLTALTLSFNNLKTKFAQTLLTSFAGSIGIVGIALILALSTGVNTYIDDIQKETMSSYPLTVSAETFDMAGFMPESPKHNASSEILDRDGIYANLDLLLVEESVKSSIIQNNLNDFKVYLDNPDSEINQYLGENGVLYSYDLKFDIFATDADGNTLNTNSPAEDDDTALSNNMQMLNPMMAMTSMFGEDTTSPSNFSELMPSPDGTGVNALVTDSYDLLHGSWPTSYDEVVLVLNANNEISSESLYQLGFITKEEYSEIKEQITDGQTPDTVSFNYTDTDSHIFTVVPYSDYYTEVSDGIFAFMGEDPIFSSEASKNGIELKISGVIKPLENNANATITSAVAYTKDLTDFIIDYTNESEVVLAQENDLNTNILTGFSFAVLDDESKIADATTFISNLSVADKASFYQILMYSMSAESDQSAGAPASSQQAQPDEQTLAYALDAWLAGSPEDEILLTVYDEYLALNTLEDNLSDFGKVSLDSPSAINIYADTFEAKDGISACIEDYNQSVSEDSQIAYTDYVALLTSSVTSIVDVISYVLIAFVSVSLFVSCIMIGIITHISVLERTKEIGILRAIGASKRNVSQVFNAETLIIGLFSGTIGVVTSILITIPINAVIHTLLGNTNVNASLSLSSAGVLIAISVVITVIGGLVPAKKAATKDPVIALRSE